MQTEKLRTSTVCAAVVNGVQCTRLGLRVERLGTVLCVATFVSVIPGRLCHCQRRALENSVPLGTVCKDIDHCRVVVNAVSATCVIVVTCAAEIAVVQGGSLEREGIATPTLVPEDKTREVESPSVTAIDALSGRVVAVIGVCLRRKLSSRCSILVATKVRPLSSTIGQKRSSLWRSSCTGEVQDDGTLIAVGVDLQPALANGEGVLT